MNGNPRVYLIGFGDHTFEMRCNNDDAYGIAEFLFLDFPGSMAATSIKQYDIISSGPIPMLSLWEGDKRLYFGTSRYQLAYILMNEVFFCCINTNTSHHALHAGAVYRDNRCIILPGQSGNGKSTLCSWLIMNGFQYLTDELVFLDEDAQVLPITRPISLKVGPSHKSWLLTEEHDGIITSDSGSMIPHRLLNNNFKPRQPKASDIIFPQYAPDAQPGLKEISPAKSSLYLLRSHVNARNLQGHGVSEMASIVKKCRSFTLCYRSFDDLRDIFSQKSEQFA
ncbi:hypothetical protein [Desulforhopalus sp. 52FAK]